MSSTNKTPNFALNQWVESDPVLMADFNADNAALDAHVHDARYYTQAAADLLLAKKGNVQILTATGYYSPPSTDPVSFTFDFEPRFVAVAHGTNGILLFQNPCIYGFYTYYSTSSSSLGTLVEFAAWNGNTLSWYGNNGSKTGTVTYTALAVG